MICFAIYQMVYVFDDDSHFPVCQTFDVFAGSLCFAVFQTFCVLCLPSGVFLLVICVLSGIYVVCISQALHFFLCTFLFAVCKTFHVFAGGLCFAISKTFCVLAISYLLKQFLFGINFHGAVKKNSTTKRFVFLLAICFVCNLFSYLSEM